MLCTRPQIGREVPRRIVDAPLCDDQAPGSWYGREALQGVRVEFVFFQPFVGLSVSCRTCLGPCGTSGGNYVRGVLNVVPWRRSASRSVIASARRRRNHGATGGSLERVGNV